MAIVIFRSRAASQIIMLAHDAEILLTLLGKCPGERGVIKAHDISEAIRTLRQAILAQGDEDVPANKEVDSPYTVGLRQRAFPLMQMLQAAQERQVDVTWGI
jgi:Domain of unknown function (DUF1840)